MIYVQSAQQSALVHEAVLDNGHCRCKLSSSLSNDDDDSNTLLTVMTVTVQIATTQKSVYRNHSSNNNSQSNSDSDRDSINSNIDSHQRGEDGDDNSRSAAGMMTTITHIVSSSSWGLLAARQVLAFQHSCHTEHATPAFTLPTSST